MRQAFRLLTVALLSFAATGCTMCDTAHQCDYGGVGGKWQRGFPSCGRVGSNLSDAAESEQVRVVAATESYGGEWSELKGTPTPAEVIAPPDDPQSSIFEETDIEQFVAGSPAASGEIFIDP